MCDSDRVFLCQKLTLRNIHTSKRSTKTELNQIHTLDQIELRQPMIEIE